jgi:flagellar L-ring protein FlgH
VRPGVFKGLALPLLLGLPLAAGGCTAPLTASGEAALLPVGAGLGGSFGAQHGGAPDAGAFPQAAAGRSLWNPRAAGLFRDRRAMVAGDIVTVLVNVDDRAALSSLSSRSRNSSAGVGFNASADAFGIVGDASADFSGEGASSASGEGSIRRSERIELSVAATIIEVLPNGNFLVSGLQEIRVSNEKRSLGVQGVIRPKDIGPDNTVRYDQMAEARISYGGAGGAARFQQPQLVHQLFDRVAPF